VSSLIFSLRWRASSTRERRPLESQLAAEACHLEKKAAVLGRGSRNDRSGAAGSRISRACSKTTEFHRQLQLSPRNRRPLKSQLKRSDHPAGHPVQPLKGPGSRGCSHGQIPLLQERTDLPLIAPRSQLNLQGEKEKEKNNAPSGHVSSARSERKREIPGLW
jgi:hypothetical protein